MGIFSFGKKKDDDAPPRRGSRSGSRSDSRASRGERAERRSRRAERPDADALLLDPTLPEKQRARRRLVGAIALVVAAVIVLPMVLDSHPKPVTDDIAIDIPNKPAHAVPARSDDAIDTQAGVAHDALPGPGTADADDDSAPAQAAASGANPSDTSSPATAQAARTQPQPSSPAVATAKPAAPQAVPKPAAPRPPVAQAKPAPAPAAEPAAANGGGASPASPAGARFAVQLGSFKDEATARGWADKLKSAGVPAYVEHRKQADGSTATLLRAGPFADRAAASAAIAKVRDAGLTQ
ncbi:SPOR domain-containing protein [Burkholderia plantarii]|uniref:SPOR domain-containing protein n=1 Tax=Burkholderia plantarii TaxID=41899 RepID=UPI0006D8D3EB|nr:SPOR domain-containing protein [Burkholderia plantarii]ALK34092.1 sporulation domain-containing protein [Burkholderia plantarii]GLZ21437.1 sporulation protein [Burkholderia plantarii]